MEETLNKYEVHALKPVTETIYAGEKIQSQWGTIPGHLWAQLECCRMNNARPDKMKKRHVARKGDKVVICGARPGIIKENGWEVVL